MPISLVSDLSHFAALRERWSALLACAETNTIFQTHQWMTAWMRSYGANAELVVGVLEEDGRLIGVAPLVRSMRSGLRVLEFLGAGNNASDYSDFIIQRGRTDVAQQLIRWCLFDTGPWDLLDLHNLPSHSAHRPVVEKALRVLRLRVISRVCCEAPTRLLGDPASDHELVNRKSLKRHLNYFKRSQQLFIRHVSEPEAILAMLETFFQQHIGRRAGTEAESLFHDPVHRGFYREVVAALHGTDWLRFCVVEWEGRPIAFHFGFSYAGRFIWYKPSFDIALVKHSPGEVLLKVLFEYAIAQKLSEFDFTVGGEGFKHRFANLIRTNHRIRVFRSPLRYWWARARGWAGDMRRRRRGVPALTSNAVPAACDET